MGSPEVFGEEGPQVRSMLSANSERSGAEFSARLVRFATARSVLFVLTCGLVLFILTRRFEGEGFSFSAKLTLGILGAAQISALVQRFAAKKHYRMYGVALTLIFFDQLLFAGLAYVTGGVSSGATSLFGVSCVVGALLLGGTGAVVATLSGAIFFSLILLVELGARDLLPPDQIGSAHLVSSSQAAYYYVFTMFMLVLVGLLSGYLSERLQRAGGELHVARRRVIEAERMAALGRLAAGLAHEIRNPLGAISASVQMLRTGTENEEDRELCEIVLRESARLDELVTDMMDLSKPRTAQKSEVDIGMLVDDVVLLSRRSGRAAEDVELLREGVGSALIDCDPDQIRQLIWNLVRNAVQASAAGGIVSVRLEAGESLRLVVQDDGIGIDSAAQSRLFDAFYTTRSKGTGLGLAVVKRIADDHGFAITVLSERGEGAQFVVDFGPARATAAHLP